MLDLATYKSITLPFGFSEAVDLCKEFLHLHDFSVTQLGTGRIIGWRPQDSTRIVLELTGVSVAQTDVRVAAKT